MTMRISQNIGQNSNMFTNVIKRNNLSMGEKNRPEYTIINRLEESFFFQDNNDEHIENNWQQTDPQKLMEIYNTLKNDKNSLGYSKSTKKEFLRMFTIRYYASDGCIVFPSYFTSGTDGVNYIADPVYKDIWDNFDYRLNEGLSKYKILTHLTFNCVLSDGRIVEYLFDREKHYNQKEDEKMFNIMKGIKKSYELKDSLDVELVVNQEQEKKLIFKL
jgi:hypothetical protein